MFDKLRQLLRRKEEAAPPRPAPAVPAGQRIYAVGDIHGRLDLFEALVAAIEADDASRGAPAGTGETTIILLGDLIDRGPHSAGVIAAARDLARRRPLRAIVGNHEEMLLDSMQDSEVLRHFLRFGGRETVLSYPVDLAEYREMTLEETRELLPRLIPAEDIEFILSFEDAIVYGDYLFVHAGIRPDVALTEQSPKDLRWIRQPFLSHRGDHGWCVVHGHTIFDEADFRDNRIGIDTGAYMSGRLTALGLEGTERWLITAQETEGAIATSLAPAG